MHRSVDGRLTPPASRPRAGVISRVAIPGLSLVLPGGMADRSGYQFQAAVVEAGDGVTEAGGGAGGEAGRDAHDGLLPARWWRGAAPGPGGGGHPLGPPHAGGGVDTAPRPGRG